MKQYTYVELRYEGLYTSTIAAHRDVIGQYAAAGWRYVDHIVTKQSSHGQAMSADLIFEKDAEA